ncbi:MAG: virulence protein RhuM/Fic/DOC family protein [Sulfurimonas sp.]|nr:virulence protein RhuM/Fic/DOC family protein [Sulfurimonas sp.]
MSNEVLIYTDENGEINLDVSLENETVWLSQKQMGELLDKNTKTINEHIKNIYKEQELEENSTIRKFQTVQVEGKREVKRDVNYYNLDVIISVGYRVKSKRGTQFRIWATKILKEYLIEGYSINQKRFQQKQLNELSSTIELIKNSLENKNIENDEAKGLFDIINNYAKSWSILQSYDEDSLASIQGTTQHRFTLEYKEIKQAIEQLKSQLIKRGEATPLFGNEKDDSLEGIIGNIYQTFGGDDLIPSVEAKAGNLLYYIIKDHPFSDGNKRIGSFLFILFLSRNNLLYKPNGELRINDNALVSLALLTATSDPKQKELMVKLVVNLLGN